jgi:hypothetical protein
MAGRECTKSAVCQWPLVTCRAGRHHDSYLVGFIRTDPEKNGFRRGSFSKRRRRIGEDLHLQINHL